jgi:hypothetical protein
VYTERGETSRETSRTIWKILTRSELKYLRMASFQSLVSTSNCHRSGQASVHGHIRSRSLTIGNCRTRHAINCELSVSFFYQSCTSRSGVLGQFSNDPNEMCLVNVNDNRKIETHRSIEHKYSRCVSVEQNLNNVDTFLK